MIDESYFTTRFLTSASMQSGTSPLVKIGLKTSSERRILNVQTLKGHSKKELTNALKETKHKLVTVAL